MKVVFSTNGLKLRVSKFPNFLKVNLNWTQIPKWNAIQAEPKGKACFFEFAVARFKCCFDNLTMTAPPEIKIMKLYPCSIGRVPYPILLSRIFTILFQVKNQNLIMKWNFKAHIKIFPKLSFCSQNSWHATTNDFVWRNLKKNIVSFRNEIDLKYFIS